MNKIEDLVKEIAPAKEERPKTYTAEVSHTDEEGIVWVRLPGAEEDTPTASSATDVKMGDIVNVEWRNNKLYIVGNYTNPSAGVERVVTVDRNAQTGIKEAQETAGDALLKANKQVQYFWTDEEGAHVTKIPKDDFIENPAGGNTLTDSTGLDVRDGEISLAKFGEQTRIGQNYQSHLDLDYHSLQMIDKEGNSYFYVSDLRGSDGYATITEHSTGDGSTKRFSVKLTPSSVESVTVNDISQTEGTDYSRNGILFTFTNAPASGAVITITYKTTSHLAKAFTIGKRNADNYVAPYSLAEGYLTTASGIYSHAEGAATIASGSHAHAEGLSSTASGQASHAEGDHALSSGSFSHAEGLDTAAIGSQSHAQNFGTITGYANQTAIGKYNDNNAYNAFEIGNGSSDDARSNAFEVDWNGNTTIGGHSSPIGTIVTGSESVSVPSTTGAPIKRGNGFTLDAGSWVITMSVTFPANSNGYRRVAIGASDGAYNASRNSAPATGGYETPVLSTAIVAPSSSTTYYAYLHQNSGSTLNSTVSWRAVRIA